MIARKAGSKWPSRGVERARRTRGCTMLGPGPSSSRRGGIKLRTGISLHNIYMREMQYSGVQSLSATGVLNGLLRRIATSRGFEGEKQHVIVRTMIESATVSLNDPQRSKSWWRATDAPPPIGVYSGRFSPMVTLLSALFLTVALGSVVGLSGSASKVDRIESPE